MYNCVFQKNEEINKENNPSFFYFFLLLLFFNSKKIQVFEEVFERILQIFGVLSSLKALIKAMGQLSTKMDINPHTQPFSYNCRSVGTFLKPISRSS